MIAIVRASEIAFAMALLEKRRTAAMPNKKQRMKNSNCGVRGRHWAQEPKTLEHILMGVLGVSARGPQRVTTLAITLPWAPSVNHYWRHVGSKVLISRDGRIYRNTVAHACMLQRVANGLTGRLSVRITACPPDRRRRDLDNMLKSCLDAVTHAGVWLDDSQIDSLTIVRGEVVTLGVLMLEVSETE